MGFITAVNVENGNYVQEGDVLAIINDSNNYGVVINVPFELKKIHFVKPVAVYLLARWNIYSAKVKNLFQL
jgi:multidrug efflux pump subunit AcrA (membrane-fusion protein)